MALIPEIDRLLECDEQNVREARGLLTRFTNDLPETLNQAAVLFSTTDRVFGQGLPANHFSEVAVQIDAFGLSTIRELDATLQGPAPVGQEAAYAQAADVLNRFSDRETRGVLLARLGILYATAAADLLRLRVTGPLGYVRVQCESLALMKLMQVTPAIAREWRSIFSEADGIAFYRKYQSAVKDELRNFDLEFAYNNASSTALHSRFSGAALGLEVTGGVVDGRITQSIAVKAQEFDPANPVLFFLMVLHVLRVQQRILKHLPTVCPEIDDPMLRDTRIPAFERSVDLLYKALEQRFPGVIQRFLTGVGTSSAPP